MATYLANAFSLTMLGSIELKPTENEYHVLTKKVSIDEIDTADIISAIGHADTANILSSILGTKIVPNRVSINLTYDDILYVAQYTGPRLPEGTTVLPEGSNFTFWKVKIGRPCGGDFGATYYV